MDMDIRNDHFWESPHVWMPRSYSLSGQWTVLVRGQLAGKGAGQGSTQRMSCCIENEGNTGGTNLHVHTLPHHHQKGKADLPPFLPPPPPLLHSGAEEAWYNSFPSTEAI